MTAQRQAILDQLGEEDTVLFFEPAEMDAAILGISLHQSGRPPCVVYDYHLLVDALIVSGMTEEDAEEWIEFNTLGAWMGETTPIVIEQLDLNHMVD